MMLIEWAIVIPLLYLLLVQPRAVKGTRARYIQKTSVIILLILAMVTNTIRNVAYVYADPTNIGTRLSSAFSIAWTVVLFGLYIRKLLQEDDDDWFNDRWKKLKRWVRNVRSARRRRPAFAT